MKMDHIFANRACVATFDSDENIYERVEKAVQADYSIIEVNRIETFMLERLLTDFPTLKIGVGQVTHTQQLENAYQAGAHFVTSPGFLPALVQMAQIYSINYIPGIATFSEAMQVASLGCTYVRPFPTQFSFCAIINQYLPELHLFPIGMNWDESKQLLTLPAVVSVGIMNPVFEETIMS